jgi:hypothetical protein
MFSIFRERGVETGKWHRLICVLGCPTAIAFLKKTKFFFLF